MQPYLPAAAFFKSLKQQSLFSFLFQPSSLILKSIIFPQHNHPESVQESSHSEKIKLLTQQVVKSPLVFNVHKIDAG